MKSTIAVAALAAGLIIASTTVHAQSRNTGNAALGGAAGLVPPI